MKLNFSIPLPTQIIFPVRGDLLLFGNQPKRWTRAIRRVLRLTLRYTSGRHRLEIAPRFARPQPLHILDNLSLHLRQVILFDRTTLRAQAKPVVLHLEKGDAIGPLSPTICPRSESRS